MGGGRPTATALSVLIQTLTLPMTSPLHRVAPTRAVPHFAPEDPHVPARAPRISSLTLLVKVEARQIAMVLFHSTKVAIATPIRTFDSPRRKRWEGGSFYSHPVPNVRQSVARFTPVPRVVPSPVVVRPVPVDTLTILA